MKLIQCNITKFSCVCYFVLLQLYLDGKFESSWLSFVKRTLEESWLNYLWDNQFEFIDTSWLKTTLSIVLHDQYVTNCHSQIIHPSISCTKISFSVEMYFKDANLLSQVTNRDSDVQQF